jgi:hypothetical protein
VGCRAPPLYKLATRKGTGFSIDFRRLLVCGVGKKQLLQDDHGHAAKHYHPPNHAPAELIDLADSTRTRSVPRLSEFVLTPLNDECEVRGDYLTTLAACFSGLSESVTEVEKVFSPSFSVT